MSNLDLTTEERALVYRWAFDRSGPRKRLGFYAPALLPIILFGAYGIARRCVTMVKGTTQTVAAEDFWVLALAFLGLLIFVGSRIAGDMSAPTTYRSLCSKIVEHERRANA